MRIVTWNCQMALHQKIDSLLSLNADVAVIPECSEKSVIACRQYRFNTLWFGSNPRKGPGIICREDWLLRPLPQPEQKWIVPLHVGSPAPFTLIAVWACAAGVRREDRYIRQVYLALIAHPEWFTGEAVIVAGDFNSNKIWDRKRRIGNHSDVVKLLNSTWTRKRLSRAPQRSTRSGNLPDFPFVPPQRQAVSHRLHLPPAGLEITPRRCRGLQVGRLVKNERPLPALFGCQVRMITSPP